MRVLAFASAWWFWSATAAAATLPGVGPAETLEQLGGKEYFVERVAFQDTEVRGAHGGVIVGRPPETVADTVRDVAHFKEIFPQMLESTVLTKVGRNVDAHVEVYLLNGLGKLWADMRQLERTDPAGTIYFRQRKIPGRGNFARYEFDVRITPLDGGKRSLLELWGMILPDIPLVPRSILEHENEQAVRRGVRAIRLKSLGVPFAPGDL